MNRLRAVFAGTPAFACPALRTLHARADIDVVAVYTQPDRRAGRGRKLSVSAVKALALELGIDVRQVPDFRAADTRAAFAALQPQLFVVAAYGLIMPLALLDLCPVNLNVHASLLPRWRGAAPIQRAIMAGDTRTGISIMRVVEKLDAGPVWVQHECNIEATETGASLHDKLAALGATALTDALDKLQAGAVQELPQDESLVTYAGKITPADRKLDWACGGRELERRIRALAPQPGALIRLGDLDLKILRASFSAGPVKAAAGDLLQCSAAGIDFACTDGTLRVLELQPAGRQPMDAAAFANGYGRQL